HLRQPDWMMLYTPDSPNDPFYSYQWALKNTGTAIQYNGIPNADIHAEAAWTVTTGNNQIRTAILDSGVDTLHPDLQANMIGGFDGTGLGTQGAATGNDAHGTCCAGIVAAVQNNNTGISGVAPNTKIIPVRIAYSTNGSWITAYSWITNCIDWAWNQGQADILSNSWSGGVNSVLVNEALNRATTLGRGGKGCAVVFSAGNDNGPVSYPATLENVISVTAMSMCNERKSTNSCDGENWWGSNYGSGTDVSAPGVKIYTCDLQGNTGFTNTNYYSTFNGTSAAAPMVAGVLALIYSVQPSLTMQQARQILELSCEKSGSYVYQLGVAGQPNGSWSNELGYGRVHAAAAVNLANPSTCVQAPVNVTTLASPLLVCSPQFISLSLNGSVFSQGLNLQWQNSTDSLQWNDIPLAQSTNCTSWVSQTTWFRCRMTCGNTTYSQAIKVYYQNATIINFPWNESFDSIATLPCGWTVEDVNSDGFTWFSSSNTSRSAPNHLRYSFSYTNNANDFVYSPPLQLVAGLSYRVHFWYRSESSAYPEQLELYWGNSAHHTAMNQLLFSNSSITNTTYVEGISALIQPTVSGQYFIGFKAASLLGNWDLHLDDISIEVTSTCSVSLNAGTVSGPSTGIAGTAVSFLLNGSNATSFQWEISSDNGSTWNPIPNSNSSTFTYSYLPGTYQLRVRSYLPGTSCADVYSPFVSILVGLMPGDQFNNAIPLNLPATVLATTAAGSGYTSTYSGPEDQPSPDIFYRFKTGPCTDTLIISSCSSGFDTYIHILDSTGNHLISNDDFGPLCNSNKASLRLPVQANTWYYVVIEGYGTESGALQLDLQEEEDSLVCFSFLHLQLFIQGYMNGNGSMTPALFNQFVSGATSTDVDSLDVSLYRSSDTSWYGSYRGILKSNGMLVAQFPRLSESCYIQIKGRNVLETWSSAPVSFTSNPVSYNFSTSASQTYGNNVWPAGTMYTLYNGELNQDGNIDLLDATLLENDMNSFQSGYHATDLNGDGNTDLLDSPVLEWNMSEFIYSMRP
ncbi:MAG TPA: S8 family serine peptidase, partial [Chitinophagaceae bacterium]|nr:S8 family serine peptidase [Chitinophagaceae bacterium]